MQSDISYVKTWPAMCIKENNNSGSKRAYINVIKVFHYVNWILYIVTNISPKAEILLKCYLIIIIIIIIISLLSGLMLFPGKKKWHNSGHQPVFLVLQLLFLFCHFISNTFCIILAVPSKQGFTIICAFFFFFLSNASVKWACGIYQ